MKVFVDNCGFDPLLQVHDFARRFRRRGGELVLSVSGALELLETGNHQRRESLCRLARRMLGQRRVVAGHYDQIRMGARLFQADPDYAPQLCPAGGAIDAGLCSPTTFPREHVDVWKSHKATSKRDWQTMHLEGREELQQLKADGLEADAEAAWNASGIWVAELLYSELPLSMVRNAVEGTGLEAQPDEAVAAFINKHPVCRCWVEQFLLATHRAGTLHEKAFSLKKDPDFIDYSHGAFVGVVDVFVTEDGRFRKALEVHRALGTTSYEVWAAEDLVNWTSS